MERQRRHHGDHAEGGQELAGHDLRITHRSGVEERHRARLPLLGEQAHALRKSAAAMVTPLVL